MSFDGLEFLSVASPEIHLRIKEFSENVLKAGSLISMLENKKLNTINMFVLLLERSDYRDFFVEITSSENFKESVYLLLQLHPSLLKSKITKTAIRKLNAKTNNGIRKSYLQQALGSISISKKQTISSKKRLL